MVQNRHGHEAAQAVPRAALDAQAGRCAGLAGEGRTSTAWPAAEGAAQGAKSAFTHSAADRPSPEGGARLR